MWCSPLITYYSTRHTLTLFSCLQWRLLPVNSPSAHDPPPSLTGCWGQAQIIKLLLIIKKVKKKRKKKKKQTSDSQGVYVIYLTLWTHRTETQLSLKLFKEPKDNLSCTPIKSSRKKKWQQQKCTQLKEQAKYCNVYNLTRPTLLKESVGVQRQFFNNYILNDNFYVTWSYVLTEAFWKHCMFLFFAMTYIF